MCLGPSESDEQASGTINPADTEITFLSYTDPVKIVVLDLKSDGL